MDKRTNAEKYTPGVKPSSKSEYFGKSYGQLRRETKKIPSITRKETGAINKALKNAMKD